MCSVDISCPCACHARAELSSISVYFNRNACVRPTSIVVNHQLVDLSKFETPACILDWLLTLRSLYGRGAETCADGQ